MKLNFGQIIKIRPKQRCFEDKKKRTYQTTTVHQPFLFTQKSCRDSYFSGRFNA
jgi:hypothetical protein